MTDFEDPIVVVGGEPVEPLGVIAVEKPQQCDLCGKMAELRPYGPKGEAVCFDCGMKDEAAAARAFDARVDAALRRHRS